MARADWRHHEARAGSPCTPSTGVGVDHGVRIDALRGEISNGDHGQSTDRRCGRSWEVRRVPQSAEMVIDDPVAYPAARPPGAGSQVRINPRQGPLAQKGQGDSVASSAYPAGKE